MGIRYLNKYFKKKCSKSIKNISLSDMKNKKIAVDISIYMYKYRGDNTLIESFYLMMGLFKQNNIIPIFIFDGKPPPEKNEVLKERRKLRMISEKEYNELSEKLKNDINKLTDGEKGDILNELDMLKKKTTYITKENIRDVKSLISAYGYSYYEADGEADDLCVQLVSTNKVWACMSEDMDMFMYGCPYVLRYLNLMKSTITLYDTYGILNEIGIEMDDFKVICALSGTDYNFKNEINLYDILQLFEKYKHYNIDKLDFYNWLNLNNPIVLQRGDIKKVLDIFSLDYLLVKEDIKITNGPLIHNEMRPILEKDGFIFAY
jgi:5'-3' exonuclease